MSVRGGQVPIEQQEQPKERKKSQADDARARKRAISQLIQIQRDRSLKEKVDKHKKGRILYQDTAPI